MIQRSKSWIVLGFAVALLTISLIPACGGGGSSSAAPGGTVVDASTVTFNNGPSGMAATEVQAALDELDARLDALTASTTRVHESTQSGIIVVPENSINFVVRAITFTPTNPNDRIISITAEGTYDIVNASGSATDINLSVLDGAGKVISDDGAFLAATPSSATMRLDVAGIGLSFRLFTRMTNRLLPASVDHTGAYPSSSYTIRVMARSFPSFIGQFNTLRFTIVTSEGVIVVPSSPNIAG